MARLTEEMKELIAGQQAYIGTASLDGKPSIGMKGSTRVIDDEHIAFVEMCGGRTWENIQKNPNIVIVVGDLDGFKAFRFEGEVEILTSGILFEEAKKISEMNNLQARAAIVMKVNEIYNLAKGGCKVTE